MINIHGFVKYDKTLHILFFFLIYYLFDSFLYSCLGAYKKTATVGFKTDNYLKPNSIKYAT